MKAPRVAVEPLDPITNEDFKKLLYVERDTFCVRRDRAILLFLLDTGVRASEFLAINLSDVNQVLGDILIRKGKGNKPRTVYIGKQSRIPRRRIEEQVQWIIFDLDEMRTYISATYFVQVICYTLTCWRRNASAVWTVSHCSSHIAR